VLVESRETLRTLLDEFLLIFQLALKDHNIEFKIKVTKHFPKEIYFDTERYLEILFHLIMNSIKFKKQEDPKIHVRIRCKPIEGPANDTNGWVSRVTTEVSDNGIGIEKEQQATLLYTFKAKKKGAVQGIGIGLSTVRSVTEALGGTVRL